VQRRLPTDEARDLLGLVDDLVAGELSPRVEAAEATRTFPRDVFRTLGAAGLLGLPYPEDVGGGGQPYEVYLQVVEELAASWLAVGMGVSVHALSCFPLAEFGSPEQRARWLEPMLAGGQLGAYCLSEPQSGSDAAALATRATLVDGHYEVTGTKAWISHAGHADFYNVMVRTSDDGPRGISCLLLDAATPGLSAAPPEHKMGVNSSATAQLLLDHAEVAADRLLGAEGEGFTIAMRALESGRLGIAACAVGVAQASLDAAAGYAGERVQFGRAIGQFQGVQFMLADMATQVSAARALYLDAARRKDAGEPFGIEAAKAKLFATDTAMRVTTDAVQVLGGAGYTEDHPVERWFREAKLLQIVEGTNQVQRMVIGRSLVR
jgi:alkylation response protein AidB-like acyl-CoA dehydrogenase